MQLHLPIFHREARLINDRLGVYEKDGLVQYIVNGAPVYSHAKDDLNAFRYITSQFTRKGITGYKQDHQDKTNKPDIGLVTWYLHFSHVRFFNIVLK